MAKTRKAWSKIIEESTIKVRLYTRPGGASVYYSFKLDGRKVQQSTGLKDRKQAEAYARDVVQIIAERQREGRVSNPTLAQVFSVYFRERGPLLRPERRQTTETRRDLFEAVWGGRQFVEDIGQTHVDRYAAARRAGGIVLEDSVTGETREFGAVRDGTINTDFNSLSSVFNWARKYKTNGRRLLSANPLHDVQWPKEKNVRRPVASHQRFVATLTAEGGRSRPRWTTCLHVVTRPVHRPT